MPRPSGLRRSRSRSATLLALLAAQAERGPGKGHQPVLSDGVAADLALAVAAVLDPLEGVLGLHQHVARVVDDDHLLVTLEGRGPDVGLVVSGPLAGVLDHPGQVTLDLDQLTGEALDVVGQLAAYAVELGLRPGLLGLEHHQPRRR